MHNKSGLNAIRILITTLQSSADFGMKTHLFGRYSRIHNIHEIFPVKTFYDDLSKIFCTQKVSLSVMYNGISLLKK